jgi:hypothetical protein
MTKLPDHLDEGIDSEGAPSSDGEKSRTGGLSPGMNAVGSGTLLGLTTFAMISAYRNPRWAVQPIGPLGLSNTTPIPSFWEAGRVAAAEFHECCDRRGRYHC